MRSIKVMQMRGGTSKGVYLLADDMPTDIAERDRLLLGLFGSPDARQIDGLGGAHPLTSKAAIVSRSSLPDCDVDFLFCQVGISDGVVDTSPNCGNILAGVAPFAIERGLVSAENGSTVVRIRTLNTGSIAELTVETPNSVVRYEGVARIDGVPGTAAPIPCDFLDVAGSSCGALLPTGRVRDTVDGVDVTLIDNGMPVMILAAASVGATGAETVAQLRDDSGLREKIERIRLACGPLMNLGDVSGRVVPKVALVSAPRDGGAIATRSFIPHEPHSAIGVFAAVSVATAAVMPGSVAHEVARVGSGAVRTLSVEHPTGEMTVRLVVSEDGEAVTVLRAGLLRTARKLADGIAFVSETSSS